VVDGQRLAVHRDGEHRVAAVGRDDLVRDAGERDVTLDRGSRDELVEAEMDLTIDHTVDPQPPVRRLDPRCEQRRVDAVEALVGREERIETLEPELGVLR
jgi:hypothetical protein